MSDQPRVPAGSPHGGQWSGHASAEHATASRAADTVGAVERHGLQKLHAAVGHVRIEHMAADDPNATISTAGYYDPDTHHIRLRHGDATAGTTAHELGHAFDHFLGRTAGDAQSWHTDDTEWSKRVRADQKNMDAMERRGPLGPRSYFGSRKELFAELMAHVVTGGTAGGVRANRFAREVPLSLAYVENLVKKHGLK